MGSSPGSRQPYTEGGRHLTTSTRFLVFTDLDGTLLDADTYDWTEARPALKLLRQRHIPVVPCSSKTAAEMLPLSAALGLEAPLIVENGGAVLAAAGFPGLPPGWGRPRDGWRELILGLPHRELAAALASLRAGLGLKARGISEMDASEVAALTGLSPEQAELARRREHSEPFVWEGDAEGFQRLREEADRLGLRVVPGYRFHHLMGQTDKARALRLVRDLYAALWGGGPITSIGLGDSGTDLLMLFNVDLPVLIRQKSGRYFEIGQHIPNLYRARLPGPGGWNEAIKRILEGTGP
jgi:mannosyl-3-phosphoglycerate phosphatase family protein